MTPNASESSRDGDRDDEYALLEESRYDQLTGSIAHLLDSFGTTTNIMIGIALNGLLGLLGVLVALYTTGFIEFIAAGWAIMNFGAIIAWVIGL